MAIFIQLGEQLAEAGEPVAELNNSFDNPTGLINVTEDDDILVATGEISDISGAISTIEDDDTLIATGSIGGIFGAISAIEDDDTLIATGLFIDNLFGPISAVEDDDTLFTLGLIGDISGIINVTENDDTLTGVVSIAEIRINPMLSFLNIFIHLLPNARAWRLTVNKKLRQFFEGLADTGDQVKVFFDDIWLDIFPQTTRDLDAWENQFGLKDTGLTEQERRDRLDATWKAQGDQDPTYIQETLQANGFDVYVHEWWVPGTEPAIGSPAAATPRDPNVYLGGGSIFYIPELGEALAECGEALAECGERISPPGYALVNKDGSVYPITADPATWPYYLYIGGAIFGNSATVDPKRKDEFEDICLKICPAQQWLGIIVEYA